MENMKNEEADTNLAVIEKYFLTTNNVLGVLAFSTGLSCMGLEQQAMYGWISLFFILFAWYSEFSSYKEKLVSLRKSQCKEMKACYILKKCSVALAGFIFLGSVALGICTKNGIYFSSHPEAATQSNALIK